MKYFCLILSRSRVGEQFEFRIIYWACPSPEVYREKVGLSATSPPASGLFTTIPHAKNGPDIKPGPSTSVR
jgi:hypothetical protein